MINYEELEKFSSRMGSDSDRSRPPLQMDFLEPQVQVPGRDCLRRLLRMGSSEWVWACLAAPPKWCFSLHQRQMSLVAQVFVVRCLGLTKLLGKPKRWHSAVRWLVARWMESFESESALLACPRMIQLSYWHSTSGRRIGLFVILPEGAFWPHSFDLIKYYPVNIRKIFLVN